MSKVWRCCLTSRFAKHTCAFASRTARIAFSAAFDPPASATSISESTRAFGLLWLLKLDLALLLMCRLQELGDRPYGPFLSLRAEGDCCCFPRFLSAAGRAVVACCLIDACSGEGSSLAAVAIVAAPSPSPAQIPPALGFAVVCKPSPWCPPRSSPAWTSCCWASSVMIGSTAVAVASMS